MRVSTLLLIAAAGCAAGCSQILGIDDLQLADAAPDAETPDAPWGTPVRVAVIPSTPNPQLDVLFVVDNSAGMLEEQGAFGNAFGTFFDVLGEAAGIELHAGVVSSNMGSGTYPLSQCETSDDGGLGPKACTFLGDAHFLVDGGDADGDGTRDVNYTGATAAETMRCVSQLGASGCGFEQHLGSMERALIRSGIPTDRNEGFLRFGANLAVIVLADEDDCSVSDPEIFNPDASQFGPMSSFRCFEFGVSCEEGNADPRAAGPRDRCTDRAGSTAMPSMDHFASFLRGLKADPTQVMFGAIVGTPGPVAVQIEPNPPNFPGLVPACVSTSGGAAPAVRFQALAEQFPLRSRMTSVCASDLRPAMSELATLVMNVTATSCLIGDLSGDLTALEQRCTVSDVIDLDGPGETRDALPRCADGAAEPCFRLQLDARCRLNPAHASVVVDRSGPAPVGSKLVVDCRP